MISDKGKIVAKPLKLHKVLDFRNRDCHSGVMKQFLSASAFAKLIAKNPKTIISWIEKGLIPNVRRIGHQFQIPIEELEKAKTLSQYPPKQLTEDYGQDY